MLYGTTYNPNAGVALDTTVRTGGACVGMTTSASDYDDLVVSPKSQGALSVMPNGFSITPDGFRCVEDKGSEVSSIEWICAPLIVCGRALTQEGDDGTRVVRFLDRDDTLRQDLISDGELYGGHGKVLSKLAQRGFWMALVKAGCGGAMRLLRSWAPGDMGKSW